MSELIPTDPDELEPWIYQKIGEFTVWFSRLEFNLRVALAQAVGLHESLFDAVIGSYDFQRLCEVTRAVCMVTRPDQMNRVNDLIGRCLHINNPIRQRIAHGTWSLPERGTTHMSRQKGLKVGQYFTEPRELALAVEDCRKLSSEVVFFPGGPLDQLAAGAVGVQEQDESE
jgi:hypothetical protein